MELTEKKKETLNALQELLQKNYDAEAGYQKVMEKAEDKNLKQWLQGKAQQRSDFANQLDNQIRGLNAEPKENGSTLGSAHRTWIDVKTALSSNTDEALLEECIRGEKASVKEYEDQLEKAKDQTQVKAIMEYQLSSIKNTLNTVKNLEDIIA